MSAALASLSLRTAAPPRLPTLAELGSDLLETTPAQRGLTLARPFLCVAAYAVACASGLSWLAPWCVFLVFVAVVTAAHDVVHETLGLTRRGTDVALFLLGAVLFESGHAYRCSHRRHHAVFPGPDDPEGDPARMTFVGAVLHGPVFLPRLWAWALRRRRGDRRERAWLLAEAAWAVGGVLSAALLLPICPAVSAYVAMAVLGSWVYPLLTVHLPHHGYGAEPLSQTRTLRGRLLPALFLELTYHLEHHLYPAVPTHRLPLLARRLEPTLLANGVVPRRVW
jgi:beta-carotene hydroxylase